MVLRQARVEEVAVLLEDLAAALRLMVLDAQSGNHDFDDGQAQTARPEPPPAETFRVGSRVRIVGGALTAARGRTGVLLSRRGQHYWNLRLDLQGRETVAPLVYKKETSLRLEVP